jgi:hypothetical protein
MADKIKTVKVEVPKGRLPWLIDSARDELKYWEQYRSLGDGNKTREEIIAEYRALLKNLEGK